MRKKRAYTMICMWLALVMAGCARVTPAVVVENTPAAESTAAEAVVTLVAEVTPSAAVPTSAGTEFRYEGVRLVLDPRLVTRASGKVEAAQEADAATPGWEVHPAYTRITLEDYPVMGSIYPAWVGVYPVEAFRAVNPGAAQTISGLAGYLQQAPAEWGPIPALPPRNDLQVFHTQVKPLTFGGGRGVRFLAFYSQGPVPVNNTGLVYTFQGLTDDGKYAVVVVLPVAHPDLLDKVDEVANREEYEKLFADPKLYQKMSAEYDAKPGETFTPELGMLDALVESIEVAP